MTRTLKMMSVCACILLSGYAVKAATYYVSNVDGNDHANGLTAKPEGDHGPFKSISKGVAVLKTGDTLKLIPTGQPYHETIILEDKKGSLDKPITIDAQMAVLRGSAPLNIADWKRDGDLYSSNIEIANAILVRFFMLFNDEINRMGRISKSVARKALKKKEDLNVGEWTYDEAGKKLYIKLAEDGSLNDVAEPNLRLPSGVQIIGGCEHIVIKNMIVEFFWNDGYNIHGHNNNILFENILARHNGDDGISAHETSSIAVKNYVSVDNGTGICHINDIASTNENIYILNTVGTDLYVLNKANIFSNIVIKSSSRRGIEIRGDSVVFANGWFQNLAKKKTKALFMAKECTVNNLSVIGYDVIVKTKDMKGKISTTLTPDAFDRQKTLERLKQIFGSGFPK